MGYLLTAGVLGFQIAIFVTIVGAGAMGRGKLWLVTAGWIAFTLFGSIFTAGLLLLQLLTIALSYSIGSAAAGRVINQAQLQPLPHASSPAVSPDVRDSTDKASSAKTGSWATSFGVLIIGIALASYLGREAAHSDLAQAQQIRSSNAAISASAPVDAPVMLDSQTMLTSTSEKEDATVYTLKMVNMPGASIDNTFLRRAQDHIAEKNCVDKDIRFFYQQGRYMEYVVFGSDDKRAGAFIISKHFCQLRGLYSNEGRPPTPKHMRLSKTVTPRRNDDSCNRRYQAAIAAISDDASLGYVASVDASAKRNLARCLAH